MRNSQDVREVRKRPNWRWDEQPSAASHVNFWWPVAALLWPWPGKMADCWAPGGRSAVRAESIIDKHGSCQTRGSKP